MAGDNDRINDLLAAVGEGDPGAFAELYRATRTRIAACVMRTLRDPWESDEVAQEVFLEIWEKAAQFDVRRGTAVTWMLTVAARRAIDRVRASEAARQRDMRDAARSAEPPRDWVWETVEAQLDREVLLRGLRHITPTQRAALTARYLQGRTIAETAKHLGASESAVKARVSDGIAHLRRAIVESGEAA